MWLSCHILSRDILYHFCRINNKRQQLKSPKLNDIDDLHFIRDGILFSIIPLKKTLFYAKIWVIIVLCIVALIVQKCSARSRNREFSLSFISVVNNMLLLKRCWEITHRHKLKGTAVKWSQWCETSVVSKRCTSTSTKNYSMLCIICTWSCKILLWVRL